MVLDPFDLSRCSLCGKFNPTWVIERLAQVPGKWTGLAEALVGAPKLHQPEPGNTTEASPQGALATRVPDITGKIAQKHTQELSK